MTTKERLLDAALAVFSRAGLEGYTVHAVVAESGISLGSLYHHYGSMDGLSAALYMRSMASLLDRLGDDVAGKAKAKAVVTAIVRGYLRWTADERAAAAFLHASPAASFLRAFAQKIGEDKAARFERVAGALRVHTQAKEIAALPEPLLEMLILGPIAETARRWLAGAPGIDLEEAARVLPERIWRSVSA